MSFLRQKWCSVATPCVCHLLGSTFRTQVPLRTALTGAADLLLFTATANLSIVSLNLSLMLNPVGFYQVSPHTVQSELYKPGMPCQHTLDQPRPALRSGLVVTAAGKG